jgi:hypothetical protein
MIDYLEIDVKHREFIRKLQNKYVFLFIYSIINYFFFNSQSSYLSRESIHLHIQLYQSLPPQSEIPNHPIRHHPYKNFFENVLPQAVQDHSGSIRSSILKIFHVEYLSSDLIRLIHYINRRYPRINTPRKQGNSRPVTTTTTNFVFQRENSKTDLHNIFNLFDPDLRPKATPPLKSSIIIPTVKTPIIIPTVKTPITFKRLGAKLTVLAALSRPQTVLKSGGSVATTNTK